ncbi:MAG: DUF4842 domain-containing protein [Prevotella sp.]|nr:DUF4842 domain-containing protein [Prevotella sp.]
MRRLLLLSLVASVFVSCSHDFGTYGSQIDPSTLKDKDPNEVTKEDIQANVANIFGAIDPEQDWNMVTSGTVNVTADANLPGITKVQILTESPFFNNDAKVLCEADAKSGETVTLAFEAPIANKRLIAACVNNEGVYHIQGFDIGQTSVNFSSRAATRAATRGDAGYPSPSGIKVEFKNSTLSFNAARTILADEAAAGSDSELKQWVKDQEIAQWHDKGWENDRLWKATKNDNIGNSWIVDDKGTIYRQVDDFSDAERKNLEDIFNTSLIRNSHRDNLDLIRSSEILSLYNNHLISNGTPITVTPVQLASTEIDKCYIYYYYYNPEDIPATVSEEDYVKSLPKFLAINCAGARWGAQQIGKSTNSTRTDFFRVREYLLPYYGDNLTEMMGETVMKNYKTDGKVYRFRNGQKWQNNDYYLSYFESKTNDDGRARLALFADNGETDYKNQLWQIFTDEETGLSYLYNIGLKRFLLHQEATVKDYLTSFSTSDVLAGDEIPLVLDIQNNCIRRTNSTTLGLGTDLDNSSKAARLCVSSDKEVNKAVGKWYMEECTDKSGLTLKTEIKRAATNSVTAVSNSIPAGYKVGFMIRKAMGGENVADRNVVAKNNNGCCYGFGSLNKELNNFKDHFSSAVKKYSMKIDDPRILMFSANDKTYLAFEEGADCQYSDAIIEVTQGINIVDEPVHNIEAEVYTVCFEDRPIADYDMNDIVLKARRNGNKVILQLVACGAYDDLFIRGLNGKKFSDNQEVHALFGAAKGTFVNTTGKMDYAIQDEEFEIGANTSLMDFLKQIYIYDGTTEKEIRIPAKGEGPHAVIIPYDFKYPLEKQRITDAYKLFSNWSGDRFADNKWYTQPDETKVVGK